MANAPAALVSFTNGALGKKMRGRFDIAQYYSGCEHSQNFIHHDQGPASYRNGTRWLVGTKGNVEAALYNYEFNDEQSYVFALTPLKAQFFADEGFVLEASQGITDISATNPPVVTYSGADNFSNGREVFIEGVVGTVEANGIVAPVANVNVGANTFELSGVDGSGWSTYSSGGTVAQLEEVTTPYTAAQIFDVQTAQDADIMYISHGSHAPRQLVRTSASSFTLTEQSFDFPPFDDENITDTTLSPSATTGTGITITASAVTGINDDQGFISTDVGRHVLIDNGSGFNGFAVITAVGSTTSVTADVIDDFAGTGAVTTWRLGAFSDTTGYPTAVTLYEQRLVYGGTTANPQKLYFSEAGKPNRFEHGTEADKAIFYTIFSQKPDLIRTLSGTQDQLVVGTFSGNFVVKGGQGTEPITQDSISARPADNIGTETQIPIIHNNEVIFTERGKKTLRAFKYLLNSDRFKSVDLNLLSDDISSGKIKQISFQKGRPEIIWCSKEDGKIGILTYKPEELVLGWGEIITRKGDEIVSVAHMSRDGDFDQTWVVIKRTISGSTQYSIEFFEDFFEYARPIDFYTDQTTKDADLDNWERRILEQQKQYMHLDSAVTYDGTSIGTAANAAVTPGATTGTGVTFTANNSVFTSDMVGREIWKKSKTGEEFGRAKITTFTSGTSVDCDIKQDFDSTDAMAAGDWYLTTNTLTNIRHLGTETVNIVTDGAIHPDKAVSSSQSITLDAQASVVHVGFKYTGILKTMPLEVGGLRGPSQGSSKNVFRMAIKFFDSLGSKYGTDLYKLEQINPRGLDSLMNNPPTLFTGTKVVQVSDRNDAQKSVIIMQDLPLPCNVSQLVPVSNTSNS